MHIYKLILFFLSSFQVEQAVDQFGVEFADGGIGEEVGYAVADFFELVVEGAGVGFGALLEAQGAAGEEVIAVESFDDFAQGTVQGFGFEVEAAVGPLCRADQLFTAKVLEDLGQKVFRGIDPFCDLFYSGAMTVDAFVGDEEDSADRIFAGFRKDCHRLR